jgi:uncharacterized protein YjbI with pentapeptide repeats
MSKRKAPEADPADLDEFAGVRTLTRKQVGDMIRRRESLVEVDLRGCDLSGLSFDGLDLTAAKFGEANLSKCSFRGARLARASFWGSSLRDVTFDEADLEEADFDYANLDGVTLRGAKTRKAIFPLKRVSLESVRESVRSGRKLRMEAPVREDDD